MLRVWFLALALAAPALGYAAEAAPAEVTADPAAAPAPAQASEPAPAPAAAPDPMLDAAAPDPVPEGASEVAPAAPAVPQAPVASAPGTSTLDVSESMPGRLTEFLGYQLPVRLEAVVEYRQLAVVDQDPQNDRMVLYDFKLGYSLPYQGSSVFLTFGALERFVAEEGESGWFFKDLAPGVSYAHKVDLAGLGLGARALGLGYSLRAYLPTSRASQRQALYLAPELRGLAELPVLPGWLTLGLDLRAQYRFHKYAERAGLEGGLNTRFVLLVRPFLEAEVLDLGAYGKFFLRADVNWSWQNQYPSRESYASAASSQSAWLQKYGWSVGAGYMPKPWVEVAVGVEQGGGVLRDGIVNTFFVHRDETELVIDLSVAF